MVFSDADKELYWCSVFVWFDHFSWITPGYTVIKRILLEIIVAVLLGEMARKMPNQ